MDEQGITPVKMSCLETRRQTSFATQGDSKIPGNHLAEGQQEIG